MTKEQEFLELARNRYTKAHNADSEDRAESEADNEFAQGGDAQWHPADIAARTKMKRPVLTWNRLHIFTAQVVNDGRQEKPAIKIAAMDGGTKQTAEFFQGRIRHIEYECNADIAYDSSRDQQVTSGRGFIRLRTKYAAKSFRQEAVIERIENQYTVLFDDNAHEYDRSDAEWCMVLTVMSHDAYKRKYGKKRAEEAIDWMADTGNNPAPEWMGVGKLGKDIQVAEYWVKEHKDRVLCDCADGVTRYEDELPEGYPEDQIKETRVEDQVTVMQYVIDGVRKLDETEWIGSGIPIFPLWGRESWVNGKRRTASLIRNAKDPQRLVNIYVSNIAEEISMMPKTPYIAAEGQITNHEQDWEDINISPKGVVLYKPSAIDGSKPGPPSRNVNEPPIQALVMGLNGALDAIKASMGIFDASLGGQARETSGLAIDKRQRQADNANFHFKDNESRTRKSLGRALLELIPILDKGDHDVPVRSEDGKTKLVRVNGPGVDPDTGQPIFHDLEAGNYGCSVETGPSYDSQKAEANAAYSQIAQADKNFMSLAGDLYFRTSNMPGADLIADRYEAMLPPQLRKQPQGGPQQAAQAQQQIAALSTQLQQAHAFAQSLHEQIQSKQVEVNARIQTAQSDNATKLEIAKLQEETKRVVALATLNQKDGLGALVQEVNAIKEQAGNAHDARQADMTRQHEAALQAADQGHQAQMADAQRAHDQQMAQLQQAHEASQASQAQQATADQASQAQAAQQQPEPNDQTS